MAPAKAVWQTDRRTDWQIELFLCVALLCWHHKNDIQANSSNQSKLHFCISNLEATTTHSNPKAFSQRSVIHANWEWLSAHLECSSHCPGSSLRFGGRRADRQQERQMELDIAFPVLMKTRGRDILFWYCHEYTLLFKMFCSTKQMLVDFQHFTITKQV